MAVFFHYRYQYSCFYELDSLAVVNVRDLGGIKHTFKLLVTPDSRLFQCATGEAKQVGTSRQLLGLIPKSLYISRAKGYL